MARRITGNIFKLAILCACVFAVIRWQADESQDGSIKEFAENACLREISARYNVNGLKTYQVKTTANGYSVRASATSAGGARIKIVCITNTHGGVRDISIDER